MGISSALYSGVSGLNTNGTAMSVLGNNLANTNTIGYKGSRSVFSDLLSGSVTGSGGRSQVGRGVGVSTVDQVFSQGTFDTTESNLDCAVEGEGFFIVSPPDQRTNYYTRAGAFRFDGEGFMVNAEGYRVQGKKYGNDGELLPGDAEDIQIANRGLVGGKISDEITLNTNLDSRAELKPAKYFNASDPKTYNYASSVEIYDSLGVSHVVTLYFMRDRNEDVDVPINPPPTDPNAPKTKKVSRSIWKAAWTANDVNGQPMLPIDPNTGAQRLQSEEKYTYPDPNDPDDPTKNVTKPRELLNADGTPRGMLLEEYEGIKELVFDSTGTLIDPNPNTRDIKEDTFLTLPKDTLNWGNGSEAKDIRVKFATTQYSSDSTVLSVDQNGFGAGSMTNVEIDEEGSVIVNYSNGKQKKFAQLTLGKFANPNGLEQKGANIYAATFESGPPRVGVPDKELGRVFTNSLEKSNVDMGNEMVQMITFQRGYSANSKIITTIDEMMQEVINLKR